MSQTKRTVYTTSENQLSQSFVEYLLLIQVNEKLDKSVSKDFFLYLLRYFHCNVCSNVEKNLKVIFTFPIHLNREPILHTHRFLDLLVHLVVCVKSQKQSCTCLFKRKF